QSQSRAPNAPGERRPTGTEPRMSTEPTLWAVRSTGLLGAVLASPQLLSPTFRQLAPSPWDLGTTSSCHLRQRGFGLGQPEGHIHGVVQVDGGGQSSAGLRTTASLTVQPAQPVVAVGYERTHA